MDFTAIGTIRFVVIRELKYSNVYEVTGVATDD
jgi:hypothetical protein